MVVKLRNRKLEEHSMFESSVNSYGGQTMYFGITLDVSFESSVNSYGGQTRTVWRD